MLATAVDTLPGGAGWAYRVQVGRRAGAAGRLRARRAPATAGPATTSRRPIRSWSRWPPTPATRWSTGRSSPSSTAGRRSSGCRAACTCAAPGRGAPARPEHARHLRGLRPAAPLRRRPHRRVRTASGGPRWNAGWPTSTRLDAQPVLRRRPGHRGRRPRSTGWRASSPSGSRRPTGPGARSRGLAASCASCAPATSWSWAGRRAADAPGPTSARWSSGRDDPGAGPLLRRQGRQRPDRRASPPACKRSAARDGPTARCRRAPAGLAAGRVRDWVRARGGGRGRVHGLDRRADGCATRCSADPATDKRVDEATGDG